MNVVKNYRKMCMIVVIMCIYGFAFVPGLSAELIISEYVEGSSYNKALELYNTDTITVDLEIDNYIIEMYFNGNTSPGITIHLSGLIDGEDVFVLAHEQADPVLFPVGEVDQFGAGGWFNGNDAIVLKRGGTDGFIVDSIGQVGMDPGSEWGSGLVSTKDNTLRRKLSVVTGDQYTGDAFDPGLEWEGFEQDSFDNIGVYGKSSFEPALDIIINEIDADTDGTDILEFIELYDNGTGNTSLDGLVVVLYNGNGDVSYNAFDLDGYTTNPDGYFLLGNVAVPGVDLAFSNNGLQNGADAVALYAADAADFPNGTAVTTLNLLDAVVYDTNDADDEGLLVLHHPGEPQLNEGGGDNGSEFDSLQRSPNGAGGQRNTQAFSQFPPTPDAPNNEMIVHPEHISIFDLQGEGHLSAYINEKITTSGIVTATLYNGYYLQDPVGDYNPITSDGIFVFTGSSPEVTPGDEVEVTGKISEYIPGGASTGNLSTTEIVSPETVIVSTGNPLPEPQVIGHNGLFPPVDIIDNDGLTLFDPMEDGIDFYEALEGMRVMVEDAAAVSPVNSYNEIFVVPNRGTGCTGINSRGGITLQQDDFNPERIQIQVDKDLLPEFDPVVNTGDLLGNVTGIVSYNFGNFEVLATDTFRVTSGNLEPETTTLFKSGNSFTIAGVNAENLDPNDEDGDTDIASGKFDRIAHIISNNLSSPSIVALQEIQDNDGSIDSGNVDADLTYQVLIDAILQAGGPAYDYIDIPPVDGEDGGQPGGNIRVGFLYDPKHIKVVPGSIRKITDPDLTDGDAFEASRKSLAVTFLFKGTPFTIINNHFASKGGSTPLFGQIQPYVNGNMEKRIAQAGIINDYVDSLLAADPGCNIIVIGDLNEFNFETPLLVLEGEDNQVLFNLINNEPPTERYSYIFEGNSQELDHILVSRSLADSVEMDIVHVNSEFSIQASDHDPTLLKVSLPRTGRKFHAFRNFFTHCRLRSMWRETLHPGCNRFLPEHHCISKQVKESDK
ncbi:MAG: lamin tail domain-containing protein [Spirochaetales bacterium]|nr:lamin tail domain-containing protein [Spirochaetales bacterium]